MATNPAAKRMSNPTKRNKRIGNKARNEAVAKRVETWNKVHAVIRMTVDTRIHTVTAFRHAKRHALRVGFRPLPECFMCDGTKFKRARSNLGSGMTIKVYRCVNCGTESIR